VAAVLQPAAADVQPDAAEPRAEARGVAQPVEAEQRLDGRLLRGILGEGKIAQHPRAEGEHERIMAREQDRACAAVTGACGNDECSVGLMPLAHDHLDAMR